MRHDAALTFGANTLTSHVIHLTLVALHILILSVVYNQNTSQLNLGRNADIHRWV